MGADMPINTLGSDYMEELVSPEEVIRLFEAHGICNKDGKQIAAWLLRRRMQSIYAWFCRGMPRNMFELLEYKLSDIRYAALLAQAQQRHS